MSKYIGIDVSKKVFDVAFLKSSGLWFHKKVDNKTEGFKKLTSLISKEDVVVMEASGPYHLQLALFLSKSGYNVSVVNPLIIKRYSQMRMLRAKTDKKDAKTISEYGTFTNPELWIPKGELLMQIREMYTALDLFKKQLTMSTHQYGAFESSGVLGPVVKKELKQHQDTIEKRIERIEANIEKLAISEYKDLIDRLRTIPGIGAKTSIFLVVVTNAFENFSNHKELISYLGLSPRILESGSSVRGKGHIAKLGNPQIRKMLYMCSWTAKKFNNGCVEMYDRLSDNGKPERVIKIAIVNKLLKQAFAIAKSGEDYNENHISTLKWVA
ncbi:MAG: IS110 family transposase [Sulfurovaceae bacterium]|nr:IS110 family transposase [Sulfurovaceae bacterium]